MLKIHNGIFSYSCLPWYKGHNLLNISSYGNFSLLPVISISVSEPYFYYRMTQNEQDIPWEWSSDLYNGIILFSALSPSYPYAFQCNVCISNFGNLNWWQLCQLYYLKRWGISPMSFLSQARFKCRICWLHDNVETSAHVLLVQVVTQKEQKGDCWNGMKKEADPKSFIQNSIICVTFDFLLPL